MSKDKAAINPNRLLLFKISRDITEAELKSMKFLCEEDIPKGTLEKIDYVLDLFSKISEIDDTGDGGVSYISKLLKDIGRPDLSNKLLGIEDTDDNNPNIKRNKKLLLKVEQMVAAEWARLGRHLGLEDYILDEIDANCKHVADKCSSVLRKWLKSSGCNMEELRKALLDIGRRDVVNTIDQLEGSSEESNLIVPSQPDPDDTTICPKEESAREARVLIPGGTKYSVKNATTASQNARSSSWASPFATKFGNVNIYPGSNVLFGDGATMHVNSNKYKAVKKNHRVKIEEHVR